MKPAIIFISVWCFVGCASISSDPDGLKRYEQQEYRKAVRAAKADLRRGILAYEDIQCEEEEGWRILWCYRNLLADKYGVEYRVISPSPVPGAVGQSNGYKSVTGPLIAERLGDDWEARIFREAEDYYRAHWQEVEHLYLIDRKAQTW